ncbi:hypothetical protein OD800_04375 [Pseudomonas aeruginosa]|uniref:hypothetical protein n=1 Tax=Pseudomonas TaxID=286 RepID=UPI000D691330|nr:MULTISPECIES: hypothetical protein [Pseudomonas]MBA6427559.1 hypothetical protein [Pseudomonas aeruginosa]MCO2135735.1 hypothetical protein [Pseudomonas aeruginosa]MCV4154841.1 hypothetical protein [Pseudomonas aeruginosa]MDY1056629.1 hypothetical protein [Pseudomonas aeruginosa]RUI21565.1 hypothetical protein IPC443_22370 [Pseudomonas aeruginosa]
MDKRNWLERLGQVDANSRTYGTKVMILHLSALKPDTQPSHAQRHGKLFTTDEVRQWLDTADFTDGCRCAFAEVLMDEGGNPLVPAIIDRARRNYEVMKAKGKGGWTKL